MSFPHDATGIVSRPLSQRENKISQNLRNTDLGKHLNQTMVDQMMIFRYKVDTDAVLQNQTIEKYLNGKILFYKKYKCIVTTPKGQSDVPTRAVARKLRDHIRVSF